MKYGNSLQNVVRTRLNDLSLKKEHHYAYVTDIVVGSNDPELEGAVRVILPDTTSPSEWIFPINYHTRAVPAKGELVLIYPRDARGRRYYGPAINIHNYPAHNAVSAEVVETPDYEEPDYVNPYRLFSGDTLFEGRFGQSIRFSQTLPGQNVWSEGKGKGRSAIIISSGQQSTDDSSILIQENLNKDAAALVLLENGKLKFDGATDYEGNQALVISDRIHLHARKDDVLITTLEGSIDVTANNDIKLNANQNISLEDTNWKATLTDILSLIEKVFEGGLPVGSAVTLPSPSILTEIALLKKKLE